MVNKLTKYCNDFALLSFSYIITLFIFTCIGFFIGIPITIYHFYILSIIHIFINFAFFRRKKKTYKEIICLNISMFFLLAISIVLSMKFFDLSYDGQGYHQEAIIQLSNGWNPFLEPIVDSQHSIWISHYGKFTWIIGTIFYKLTSSIESAKAINIFIALPTLLYSFVVLYNAFNKKILAFILAILLLLNPVYTNQALTFYVDQLVYIGFVIAALSIFNLVQKNNNKDDYIILACSIIFISNVKFTGLGYAGVLAILFNMFIFIKNKFNIKSSMPLISYTAATFVITIIICGFNPYITNLKMGHPLYPLSGPNKVDIMTPNTPEYFRYDGTIKKFVKSYYGIPGSSGADSSDLIFNNNLENLKIKFKTGLDNSFIWDTRIGGFGPLTALFITFIFISSIYIFFNIKNKKIYSVCRQKHFF